MKRITREAVFDIIEKLGEEIRRVMDGGLAEHYGMHLADATRMLGRDKRSVSDVLAYLSETAHVTRRFARGKSMLCPIADEVIEATERWNETH